MDSENEIKRVFLRDPVDHENLITENEIDEDFMDEQALLTAEDIAKAEEMHLKKKKIVQKGTSDYQAAWLVDSDEDYDDEESDFSDEENDNFEIDEEKEDDAESNDEMIEEDMESIITEQEYNEKKYDEKVDFDEEINTLVKIKEEKMCEIYPDEIDTPLDKPAKIRFAKYRGLKSFHKSFWEPDENLPRDYSRIFQFQNFKKSRKIAFENVELADGPDPGEYVRVEILNFADGVSSELFIASADRNDGAHYNCKAENAYGKDEKTNKLQVIESPGSPSQVSIRERWSRSVSISWQSPYTGNAQLTGYIIQYWRETPTGLNKRLHEVNVSASLSFYLLKDLLPGTSYELSILAENEVGRGNSSQVVRFTTGEEEPEASPLDVLVESRWPTTIRISWKPPPEETHNGKILGYYIGYKLSSSNHQGSFSYKTVPVLHNSYEYFLTSLHKGTEYIVIVKAYNSAGSGPSSQEMLVKTLSGDLPLAPRLHILTTTINSVHLLWRPSTETSISGNNANTKVLGYSLYYKIDEHNSNWREISVPANENKVEQEYILEDLQVNTFYRVYITATNSYGQGDPSNMVTIKTNKDEKSSVLQTSIFPSTNQVSMSSDLDIISVITITIAVVIVVFVIVVACVCVKKAQLEALRTPIDLSAVTLPRNMTDAEKSVYIGNTHRYVDFDKSKPLMQGNYSFDTGFPVPYSTMPLKDSQMSEEMKSYVAHQKPWDRPLPPTAATNKRKSGLEIQQHVYDCPQ
ncbi:hypothetical protein RND71_043959 [Anisodus tanguticus]|uniref:Fibronectin type-III domain-containing protein n=1 Tax=Anisodus tanguticus TaxID=243964 RepID=A0AAE1QN37_9SOLA|nr:hypothetical protein RND71_043959 [Anisodus tanguticus]